MTARRPKFMALSDARPAPAQGGRLSERRRKFLALSDAELLLYWARWGECPHPRLAPRTAAAVVAVTDRERPAPRPTSSAVPVPTQPRKGVP